MFHFWSMSFLILTTLLLATLSSCIEQKDANPNAMLALLYPRERVYHR
ncbi:MAG: hypothetical protein H7A23_20770 [Leptospiraceae bacterium]|nr:hypothetical protein [Leptospiraceae bacterium]